MPAVAKELEQVDRLLGDERFFAPYRRHFHPTLGRPSIPIETYVRMMFLKCRYRRLRGTTACQPGRSFPGDHNRHQAGP